MSSRLINVFLVILLFTSAVFAQYRPYKFKRITLADGLSQSSVGRIFEDKYGFIWISTEDGLNRYDGSSIKVYRHNPSDSNTIMNSWVGDFLEDKSGRLWLMPYSNGLVMYDREHDSFKNFLFPEKSDNVSMIYDKESDNIWLSVRNQVYYFNTETGVFTGVLSEKGITHTRMTIHGDKIWVITSTKLFKGDRKTKRFEEVKVGNKSKVFSDFNSIAASPDGRVIIGCRFGMYIYSPAANEIELITTYNTSNAGVLSFQNDAYLYDEGGKYLWVSILNGGLIRMNMNDASDILYYSDGLDVPLKYSISTNRIHYLMSDNFGKLWLGTDYGISYYDNYLKRFISLFNSPDGSAGRKVDSYNFAFTDKSGNTWLSTRLEGVSVIMKNKNFHDIYWFYDRFIKDIEMTNGEYQKNLKMISEYMSNLTIRDLLEDSEGNIWMASDNKLIKLVRKTGRVEVFNPMSGYMGFPANNVGDIIQDNAGRIWLLPYNGEMSYLNDSHTTSVTINNALYSETHPSFVYAGYIDRKGVLWYGDGGFIEKYDIKSGKFTSLRDNPRLKNNSARFWFEDSDSVIWIGATEKLVKHNRIEGTYKEVFLRYKNTKEGTIYPTMCLAVDSDSNFWIGTYGGGLVFYNKKTGEMKNYRVDEGLPNDYILELQFDKMGFLWISTNDGLSQFDVKNEKFVRYNTGDGTVSREFNAGSSLLTRDGIMLFGGTEGLTAFYPDSITRNTRPPNVVLTAFKKFNKEVKLTPDIQVAREIEIDYKDNLISFQYAALNFVNPDSNKYAYMLEGFENNWIENGNRREVWFTNLDPGEYIFRVKASNNDGVWNEKGASVRLVINPPFYMTWWFKLLMVVFLCSVLYYLYMERIKSIRAMDALKISSQEKELENEKRIKTEISRNLHDEVNTELTLIGNKCLELSESYPSVSELKLELQSLRLLSLKVRSLIDDVIWFIRPENESGDKMVTKLTSTVGGMLKFIDYDLDIDEEIFEPGYEVDIHFKRQLYLILKELLNNIVKHSEASWAGIKLLRKGEVIHLEVVDNGKGFDLRKQSSGTGLKNIQHRVTDIEGLIEIKSTEGTGVKATVSVSIKRAENGKEQQRKQGSGG